MFDLLLLWRCIRGPELYKLYKRNTSRIIHYCPNTLEILANKAVFWTNLIALTCGILLTAYLIVVLLLLEYCTISDLITIVIVISITNFLRIIVSLLQGIGRMKNRTYVLFCWNLYKKDMPRLRLFDFDFKYWPVNFQVKKSQSLFDNWFIFHKNPYKVNLNPNMYFVWAWLIQSFGFAFAHTCGSDCVYPGSSSNSYLSNEQSIQNGRDNLVLEYCGMRAKVCTADGNQIDTMYIDNRTREVSRLGRILVICCEGSETYYENGVMYTPIHAGYSVLGWNTPGFANSSGRPYPRQVKNAIEAVVQYAIDVLKYNQSDIVIYGWNIGTYAAAWGGVMFPNILSLVLDAPFDDIIQLSPRNNLSIEVICKYFDINICNVLQKYNGPIHIIRRVYDEVLSVSNNLRTNRTNFVTFNLITNRYQQFSNYYYIVTLLESFGLQEDQRIHSEVLEEHRKTRECLKLVSTYMSDYKASHTTRLSIELLIRSIDDSIEEQPIAQPSPVVEE